MALGYGLGGERGAREREREKEREREREETGYEPFPLHAPPLFTGLYS
jgi:hypothetical protein